MPLHGKQRSLGLSKARICKDFFIFKAIRVPQCGLNTLKLTSFVPSQVLCIERGTSYMSRSHFYTKTMHLQ